MWTIFNGLAEDPGPILWDVFHISPASSYPSDVQEEMDARGVSMDMPQIEDVAREPQPRADVDDIDAALAFLRSGGALCKVPDEEGSKYWRLLVVEPMALARLYLRLAYFDDAILLPAA